MGGVSSLGRRWEEVNGVTWGDPRSPPFACSWDDEEGVVTRDGDGVENPSCVVGGERGGGEVSGGVCSGWGMGRFGELSRAGSSVGGAPSDDEDGEWTPGFLVGSGRMDGVGTAFWLGAESSDVAGDPFRCNTSSSAVEFVNTVPL